MGPMHGILKGPWKTDSLKFKNSCQTPFNYATHKFSYTPPQKWLDTAIVKWLTYDNARNRAPDDCAKGSKQLLEPIVASQLLDCDNYCSL
jgi:hypothetical protein